MLKKMMVLAVATTALAFSLGIATAAEQERSQQQIQKQEQIYGSQMMTPQEREEYRVRMRNAKTVEEREQIRKEHHEQMKTLAKDRGITLPDEPPAMGGGGMRPGGGMGPGSGMSPGGGMGPGGGRNR